MRKYIFLLGIIAAIALTACTRKVYVPVENTVLRTDTVYKVKLHTDSVTVTERVYESDARYDSIAPILDSLNRVIGWDRYHFRENTKKDSREIDRLRAQVDSLKAARVDSVEKQIPYPVEKPLTKWERAKLDVGGMALGTLGAVVVAAIVAVIVWITKRRRRR